MGFWGALQGWICWVVERLKSTVPLLPGWGFGLQRHRLLSRGACKNRRRFVDLWFMVATPLHPDLIFSLEKSCDTVGKKYWFLAGFVAGFSLWMFWFILGQAVSKGALVKSFIASPAIFLGSLAACQPSILKNWRRLEYNCNHCWGHWTQ